MAFVRFQKKFMEIDSVLDETRTEKKLSVENVDDYNLWSATGNQCCIYRCLIIDAKETIKYTINVEVISKPVSAHECL